MGGTTTRPKFSVLSARLRGACILVAVTFMAACGGSTTAVSSNPTSNTPPNTSPPLTPPPSSYALSVSATGSGTVSSDPAGISCGTACRADFTANTSVRLIATPGSGQEFAGWGGACSGSGACTVTMSATRSVTAGFRAAGAVDANCDGSWNGTEENRTITAWPYRDCFRTNPVGTRTRLTANNGGEIAWEPGAGWNGQNALRVRPPDGSLGRLQGYAGLGEHTFHAVRTKRLNIRYLFRYNANWARYAQNTKWDIAIKYDYSDPSSPPGRREGCERGIVETRGDPLDTNPQNGQNEDFVIKQGVCNQGWTVPNRSGWHMAPGVRENEWISVENEFDLDSGWYRTYITTRDGTFNQSLHTQINIGTDTYGADSETVPSPYWWGSIDCSTGCFWGWPDDGGSYPRPADTYIWFSHFVMSNSYIGPPVGFVQ